MEKQRKRLAWLAGGICLLFIQYGQAQFVPIGEPATKEGAKGNSPSAPAPTEMNVEEMQNLSMPSPPREIEKISGTVRIVRRGQLTEVFFKDISGVFTIAPTEAHNQIMQKCLDSQRTGKAISLSVDSAARQIIGIGDNKPTKTGQ